MNNFKNQILDDSQPLKIYQHILLPILEGFHLTTEMINLLVEESESLENYFNANKLMLDCKEAAVLVSLETWNEIEDRMLRPTNKKPIKKTRQ